MPTKTDRILSYLPGTFRALPRPTALYSVVDAFGRELLSAENSLAAVLIAHWVDHADRGSEFISDLACIASLYGLEPRGSILNTGSTEKQGSCPVVPSDESVEEFREHLKRYVRTFLEGTATVQGILRVTAESLGLRIADEYADLDTWWTREDDALSTLEPRGDDAAKLLLGVEAITAHGELANPARVTGNKDLSHGVDLSGASALRLKVDKAAPVDIDLAKNASDPANVSLDHIKEAINDALGAPIANHDNRYLTLTSPEGGADGRLEVIEVAADAAPRVLGLRPLTYHGDNATFANVTGKVDLEGGVDLSHQRYLRLLVDGSHLAEVDCAGTNPDATTLDEIKNAINHSLGITVASHDGHHLALISPTTGFASRILFQSAAAQDAKETLFGPVERLSVGHDPLPAEVVGTSDLSDGVDLSARSKIRVSLNDEPSITVDCAGPDAARTLLSEIVAALNAALGPGLASHDGRFLHLASPTPGPASKITLLPLSPKEDASKIVFGIDPRVFHGAASTRARLVGTTDLSNGVDLSAVNAIQIGIDHGPLVEVDLPAASAVTLNEIRDAINTRFDPDIASHDGQHIVLTSQTGGGASRIEVAPLATNRYRRFVTRAFITDEAAQTIFGFIKRQAQGIAATRARIVGKADLSRGVDLRNERFLRLKVDDWPAVDIDCAGARPRATLVGEIVEAINTGVKPLSPVPGALIASTSADGQNLVLTSPTAGATGRVAFEPARIADALDAVMGVEPTVFHGVAATRVLFVGTVDLSESVDLSAADHINIGVDGKQFEIACANKLDPEHTTLDNIVLAINLAFNATVARHDDKNILLVSSSSGAASRIDFLVPATDDATAAIFGINPPRSYRADDAIAARAVAAKDLQGGANLSRARFLRISAAGAQPVDIDCAARAIDPGNATLTEIATAVNDGLKAANIPASATHNGKRLIITTEATGAGARLDLLAYTAGDARVKLLGDVSASTSGSDPLPAIIEGEVSLLEPANLSESQSIWLSVDGGRAARINVAGFAPGTTFLDEIVSNINAEFPDLASASEQDHLLLTSPTRGESSRLELLPSRAIELIEYSPTPAEYPDGAEPELAVRHGAGWRVNNPGAADAGLKIEMLAPHGAVYPQFVNHTLGQRIRLLIVVQPGERIEVWSDPQKGLRGAVIAGDENMAGDEKRRPISLGEILAGLICNQVEVPFDGECSLSNGYGDDAANLQLNNWLAKSVVILRARKLGEDGNRIKVSAEQAILAEHIQAPPAQGSAVSIVGRLIAGDGSHWITDGSGTRLARLRAAEDDLLNPLVGHVVAAYGPMFSVEQQLPLMIVERIGGLFSVTLRYAPDKGEPVTESYEGVTIGVEVEGADELAWRINRGREPSRLVSADHADKSSALVLPRGQSRWSYTDCYGARFNRSSFNSAHFAGGLCKDRAAFNISHFAPSLKDQSAKEKEVAVFSSASAPLDPLVEVRFRWSHYQAGAFAVNLPVDLPERFGARFNQARFAKADDKAEEYKGAVTEPKSDPFFLKKLIEEGLNADGAVIPPSTLVNAKDVDRVPIGFEAVLMPFRGMRRLIKGSDNESARIYLAEKSVPYFIELTAIKPGTWGNDIAVTARKAGPATFDVSVTFLGARFESARRIALGGEHIPTLVEDFLRPSAIGILQGKAAGIKAEVTRDGADFPAKQ